VAFEGGSGNRISGANFYISVLFDGNYGVYFAKCFKYRPNHGTDERTDGRTDGLMLTSIAYLALRPTNNKIQNKKEKIFLKTGKAIFQN